MTFFSRLTVCVCAIFCAILPPALGQQQEAFEQLKTYDYGQDGAALAVHPP